MFASLKNKIKEETGSEVPPLPRPSGRRYHRGRLDSFNSMTSIDDISLVEQKDAEIAALRLQCNDIEAKCDELTKKLEQTVEEKERLEKANALLEESVRVGQVQKDLICEEQDKIQNIQLEEISKLKNLVMFRDQEAVDRLETLKQTQQQLEQCRSELTRLQNVEPMLEDVREKCSEENEELKKRLNEADVQLSEQSDAHQKLEGQLRDEIRALSDKIHDLTTSLESERSEKAKIVLKNAEISQSEEILKQNLRAEQDEINELSGKVDKLKKELKERDGREASLEEQIQQLQGILDGETDKLARIDSLTTELSEKNKTIKQLNQRLGDMKKTLQQEIKSNNNVSSSTTTLLPDKIESKVLDGAIVMDEVNFKYLKHVIFKFLTSREVEARHLIRAVSTLLHLTGEEEKALHETLDFKSSWFGGTRHLTPS